MHRPPTQAAPAVDRAMKFPDTWNPRLLNLGSTSLYRATVPLATLREDIGQFDAVVQFHRDGLRQYQQANSSGCALSGLLLFAFFMAVGLAMEFEDGLAAIAAVLLLVAVVFASRLTAIYGSSEKKEFHQKRDFGDRASRYQFVDSVLEFLQADASPEAEFPIAIDLLPATESSKLIAQAPDPRYETQASSSQDANLKSGLALQKNNLKPEGRTFYYYYDEFLKLRGRLRDRSRFFLRVGLRQRVRRWTNENGNRREKVKFRGYRVRLDVAYPPHLAPWLQGRSDEVAKAVKLPKGCVLKKLAIGPQKLSLHLAVPPNGNLLNATKLAFLSAYHLLNEARVRTRKGA